MFLAITVRGRSSSTLRSWAPRRPSASREMSMPGEIAPPTYSPRGLTTSKVVAVPKSTTMAGPSYRLAAASALTTRSAPTSRGLSISTGTPVRTPGSTTTLGSVPKWRTSMSRHSCSTAGTVEQTAIPSTWSETLLSRRSPLSRTFHSSAVRRSSVATRQWSSTSPSSTTPSTVWELPMSAHRRVSLQVHPQVEDLDRVGQRAHRDEVDAGLRDVAGAIEGEAAGCLEGGPGE